jgi:hypothetical protein
MYVLFINDRGQERNFLATDLKFVGNQLRVTINGCGKAFDLIELMDVASVEQQNVTSFRFTARNTQTRLS